MRYGVRLYDISQEYAVANKIMIFVIVILLLLPPLYIFAVQYNNSLASFMKLDCFVKGQIGKPCPTCGLTRSIVLLYKGEFYESFSQYANGYIFVLLLLLQLVLRAVPFINIQIITPYLDIIQMILCGLLWIIIR